MYVTIEKVGGPVIDSGFSHVREYYLLIDFSLPITSGSGITGWFYDRDVVGVWKASEFLNDVFRGGCGEYDRG